MKKVFILGPVRNISQQTEKHIREYANKLRERGYMVYWPLEDTDQKDKVGLRICMDNREAIFEADEVHIWFDSNSIGSIFDLGMVFAFLRENPKKVFIINKSNFFTTPDKSFNNIMSELEKASQ